LWKWRRRASCSHQSGPRNPREAESQIRQLIAHYSFEIDDRLIESVRSLFTEDGILKSANGVMYAKGAGDFPEHLPSWIAYEKSRGRA